MEVVRSAIKWTPRVIVAGFAGYYSLGYAYEMGFMHQIDLLAIAVIKRQAGGRVAIGALMPIFQPYAAWGVRLVAAGVASLTYSLVEYTVLRIYLAIYPKSGDVLPSPPP
jgi:hypothetical protein